MDDQHAVLGEGGIEAGYGQQQGDVLVRRWDAGKYGCGRPGQKGKDTH